MFGMLGLLLFVLQLVFARSFAVASQTCHLHSEEEIRTPTCPSLSDVSYVGVILKILDLKITFKIPNSHNYLFKLRPNRLYRLYLFEFRKFERKKESSRKTTILEISETRQRRHCASSASTENDSH